MSNNNDSQNIDIESVLQNSIEQVSKLTVTEGHYSQVFTRKNTDSYLWDMIKFEKQAVILGLVDADVNYDLSQLKYRVDEQTKKIVLLQLPEAEIDYNYNFKWYDLDQSRMNQFSEEELNKIQDDAKNSVRSKIDESMLRSEGDRRLIEELNRMWSGLTALGWTIEDQSAHLGQESNHN